MVGNTAYVASRAKSRRKKLADLARMRQLINQSTDQLTASVVTWVTPMRSISMQVSCQVPI